LALSSFYVSKWQGRRVDELSASAIRAPRFAYNALQDNDLSREAVADRGRHGLCFDSRLAAVSSRFWECAPAKSSAH
jgi:hypothetical protein